MNAIASQSSNQVRTNVQTILHLVLIVCLWFLTVTIVNPIGEFPFIDDSVYESIVRHLFETGEFRLTEVSTFPTVTTTLWGALFCLPFGVSFTALRISTLVAGLLGLFGTYTLVRDFHPRGPGAFVGALAIACNPVYYALSYTFMTDVPFIAMVTWSAVFLIRSLKSRSGLELLGGTVMALGATLSRQIALTIPLAYAAALLLCRKVEPGTIIRAAIPSLVCIPGILGFNNWLAHTGRVPAMYGFWGGMLIHALNDPWTVVTQTASNLYVTVIYLGLFLFPVQVFFGAGRYVAVAWRTTAGRVLLAAGIALMTLGAAIRMHGGDALLLPLNGHVLVKSGIGLLWMRGAEQVPSLSETFWWALTAVGVLGAVPLMGMVAVSSERLIGLLSRRATVSDRGTTMMFLAISSGLSVLPFIVVGPSDRYVLPCIPFLGTIVALSRMPSEFAENSGTPYEQVVSYAFLAIACLFSIGGTRDYLEWNRLRWQAAHDLMRHDHVAPEQIDGGDEFNGVYRIRPPNMDAAFKTFIDENKVAPMIATFNPVLRRQLELLVLYSWRPPTTPYLISFGKIAGYSVVRQYTYHRWVPFYEETVVASRKD